MSSGAWLSALTVAAAKAEDVVVIICSSVPRERTARYAAASK